ncbi:phosphate ABC transporter permease subunit PstC [bacterium]|nr:MAG: phosphate ABC transporter permease subunit PstC [bacterium]
MAAIPPDLPVAGSRPAGLAGRSRSFKERAIQFACFMCAAVSILTTVGIVFVLLSQALEFFRHVSPVEFFTGREWSPAFANPKFGVLPLVSGTLLITIGAAVVALPLGLLSAIYLAEYAHPRVRAILKPLLEILAGIPTVVYGYFALFHITPWLKTFIPGMDVYNALSASIVVGVMILPLVSSLCEDAISAVPKGLREAAYGLGSTKLEVTAKVVVPAALSGIAASFILATSRAVGETMAVTLAAGQVPNLTADPRKSVETMTAFIVQISKGDIRQGSTPYLTIFAVGATLFAMTMALNIFATRLVRKYRQVYV